MLIHGASGGVGVAATQFAVAAGATVIGTAGTDEGVAVVRAQGARHAVNHKAPGYLDEIVALSGGRGPDVILEMLANVNLDHDLTIVAPSGRIVVIGNRGRVEIDAAQDHDEGRAGVRPGAMGHSGGRDPPRARGDHRGTGASGAHPTRLVGTELPLNPDAARAHQTGDGPRRHARRSPACSTSHRATVLRR